MINFGGFLRFWKIQEVQDSGPKMAAVWEQNVFVTSSADVADLNKNLFGRTIFPLSFVVIALILSELRGGGRISPLHPSSPTRPKNARSEEV